MASRKRPADSQPVREFKGKMPKDASSEVERLTYSVHSASSHSAAFVPENILVDKPDLTASRWSLDSQKPPHWIVLELTEPALLKSITFGKYETLHNCNMKTFAVKAGLTLTSAQLDNMQDLIQESLRNDSTPETFTLQHTLNGVDLPCRYIKVIPFKSWQKEFNISIWHIALHGIVEPAAVAKSIEFYDNWREKEAIRMCLKHFRRRNYLDCFEKLQQRTKIQLEDPMLEQLYECIVTKGDFLTADKILEDAASNNLFHEHICGLQYTPRWRRLNPVDQDGMVQADTPGPRGGHQMCIDNSAGVIYLLGGWNGVEDLADFWRYDISADQWVCISHKTQREGGPGKRSCHKLCINEESKQIYVLGRFSEDEPPPPADFFRYDIESESWEQLARDTRAAGGPGLIYDHQMSMDPTNNLVYVFGGKILGDPENNFSGLYSYSVDSNTWRAIRPDIPRSKASAAPPPGGLPALFGHSMVYNQSERNLYIFGGQRQLEFLNDFYKYDIQSDTVIQVPRLHKNGPDAGFTQRATIDTDVGEFYVFSGLVPVSKAREIESVPRNAFWVYNMQYDSWHCAYSNHKSDAAYRKSEEQEPVPRFAHQLVYNTNTRMHFMFGGNPKKREKETERLDDFWSLELHRATSADVLRRCRYLLRRQTYQEMKATDSKQALLYLRSSVAEVLDKNDAEEHTDFRQLTSLLFKTSSGSPDQVYAQRIEVYEAIIRFLPKHMCQPQADLVDLIKLQSAPGLES